MIVRRALLVLSLSVVLFALGLVIYASRVRASATALINSASEIHSTADAERQIAEWRNQSGRVVSENTSPGNGDHSYDVEVENGLLHRLRIVPPTTVGITVGMRNSGLRYITLVMFTGRKPETTTGIWVQEWFGSGTGNDFRVNAKDRPSKATVEFSSAVPGAERERAFGLNTKCFVKPGGCRSAEDILPGIWE
jgi:hypothetical protein